MTTKITESTLWDIKMHGDVGEFDIDRLVSRDGGALFHYNGEQLFIIDPEKEECWQMYCSEDEARERIEVHKLLMEL